ncbi:hypothetical protein ACQ859_07900 [Roseateles chitinivorans]|uniref:hypothetical protein n=1 Tax=Roseateles chitinivorans TaxID=2917965 RepID=UPI003D67403E
MDGRWEVPQEEILWALGSMCALHRRPFSAELVAKDFPPPCTTQTLVAAARALSFRIKPFKVKPAKVERMALPLVVALKSVEPEEGQPRPPLLAIVTAAQDGQVVFFAAGQNAPGLPPSTSSPRWPKAPAGCWRRRAMPSTIPTRRRPVAASDSAGSRRS